MITQNKKPNILVTASTFPRTHDDTEPRFVFDLCKELKKAFNVTVLVPLAPDTKQQEDMDGIQIVRYRYAPFRSMETLAYPGAITSRIKENPLRIILAPLLLLGLYRALRKLLKNEHIDAVHIHWLIPQGVIQGFFKRDKYPPYIITCHGADVYSLNGYPLNLLKQRALDHSQAITTVSKHLSDTLQHKYFVNNKVSVIPMGCYTNRFNAGLYSKEYFRNRGIYTPVILFVGRLDEKKGVEYLIRALVSVLLVNRDITVVIVGDGPLRETLELLSKTLGVDNKVIFLGRKTHEQLYEIYASADIFCAPSITAADGNQEGFPVVLMEAAASSLPIVTTARGDDEVVIDGKTGYIVDEKNQEQIAKAFLKLLESDELRKEFGKNGREHAKQFDWSIIGQRYIDVLHNVIHPR